MTTNGLDRSEPRRAQKAPRDDAEPQSLPERRSRLSSYFLGQSRQRREGFLRRSAAFSIRKELARNGYIAACLLVDGLVVPEPIFVLNFPWGWIVSAVALVIAIWGEVRIYEAFFSLPESLSDRR